MDTTEIVFESSARDYCRGIVRLICGTNHGLWIGGNDETIEISGHLPVALRKGLKTVRMWNQTRPRSGVLWDEQLAVWHLDDRCLSSGRKLGIPDMNALIELLHKRRELLAKEASTHQ